TVCTVFLQEVEFAGGFCINEKGNYKKEKEKGNTKGQEKEAVKAIKTGVKKAPQNNPADAGDDQSSVVNHLDNLCIFCGDKDESFTEDELDLHYWKHCPMLRRCDQCRQVRKWQSGSKLDLNG
uniref:Centrosomal protein CEP104 Zn finger domain-containing protein n=1 Tax=Hucho hucho TaxID=62062 RepID=A0A4W5L6N2_9TELE